jgi:hypothetical protein
MTRQQHAPHLNAGSLRTSSIRFRKYFNGLNAGKGETKRPRLAGRTIHRGQILRRHHEQSIVDGFFNHFNKIAAQHGRNLVRCSMDGQDAIVGGDYIFTDNSKFILAEFKYEKGNLSSERKKPRRQTLCERLDADCVRLKQSLKCHYIAWSHKVHVRVMKFNQYYPEICNKEIFGPTAALSNSHPDRSSMVPADSLIEGFLGDKYGATYFSFKEYTNWLIGLASKAAIEPIEILLNDPNNDRLEFLEFNSIPEMKNWLDQTKHRP